MEREMPDRVALVRVAASPALLEQLVGELRGAHASHADNVGHGGPHSGPGGGGVAAGHHRLAGWTDKRPVGEWAGLLSELASLLRSGQFYDRDLPEIDEPMNELASAYLRRQRQR